MNFDTHTNVLAVLALIGSIVLASILFKLWLSAKHESNLVKWDVDSINEHNRQVRERNKALELSLDNAEHKLSGLEKENVGLRIKVDNLAADKAFTEFQNHLTLEILNLSTTKLAAFEIPMAHATPLTTRAMSVMEDASKLDASMRKAISNSEGLSSRLSGLTTQVERITSENVALSSRASLAWAKVSELRDTITLLERENAGFMGKVSRAWQTLDSKVQPERGDFVNLLVANSVDDYTVLSVKFLGWGDTTLYGKPIYRWSKVYPVPTRLLAKDIEAGPPILPPNT